MRKSFYFVASLILVFTASSCTKKCVQCHATDKFGVVVNTSNTVCEHDFNRSNFEDRYKVQFSQYNPTCAEAN